MNKLPDIRVKVIPHWKQRYETPGDYYKNGDTEKFKISELGDARHEALIFIHEFVEWFLSEQRGIKQSDIDKFDTLFEKERAGGHHSKEDEAGYDKRCPIRKEHIFAEKIERMLAKELKVNWREYEKKVVSLLP